MTDQNKYFAYNHRRNNYQNKALSTPQKWKLKSNRVFSKQTKTNRVMLTNYLKARTLNETTENGGSGDFCKSNEITDDHSWVSSIERRLNAIKSNWIVHQIEKRNRAQKKNPPKMRIIAVLFF